VTHVDLLDAQRAPITAQPLYERGDPGPLVTSLAQVPELLEVALPFVGGALGPGVVDLRTKEIVILRTSVLLACRYCTQTHTVVALDAGLRADEVRALRGEGDVAAFSEPREQTLIDWVDAVAVGPGAPPAALVAALRERFADHQIVDLTMTVGATVMLNRYATALALPTAPDTLRRLAREGLA
jgi:AhpD family alkylhydroperoxidase